MTCPFALGAINKNAFALEEYARSFLKVFFIMDYTSNLIKFRQNENYSGFIQNEWEVTRETELSNGKALDISRVSVGVYQIMVRFDDNNFVVKELVKQ